jgi:biotin carboxyl carrier protein
VSEPAESDEARLVAALETEVRAVLQAVRGSAVEEICLERAGRRISLRRAWTPPVAAAGAAGLGHAPADEFAVQPEPDGPPGVEIRASMVGIFHHAREPEGAALAVEGEYVDMGQPVGVIETLGMASDVEAPAAGRLADLLPDGQPVEYGQMIGRIAAE